MILKKHKIKIRDPETGEFREIEMLGNSIKEDVQEWLDNHPEATTTVLDGSLTEAKFSDSTKLKTIKDYVTPQMYGAKGDGTTDDTSAIQSAINSGKNVYFPKATYICGRLSITGSNIVIDGGGSSILFGANSGFYIATTAHDIAIKNLDMHCTYVVDSDAETNCCVGVAGGSVGEYFAYNIEIISCSFDGGVMGIAASSVKNMLISNCQFGSFVYKPTDLAGGYGILLQSCINVEVSFSEFKMGPYGRHDIYISVDQTKSDNIQCKNVLIHHCNFDHLNLETDNSGYFYSPATQSITVRSSFNTIVKDCYFYSVTGGVVYTTSDGVIDGAIIDNCIVDSPVQNTGASEAKYAIIYNGTASNAVSAQVANVTLVNVPSSYQGFMSIAYGAVQINSCNIAATRIVCADGVTIQVSNVVTAIPYYFIRFNGTDTTNGYCRNVTFTALTGSKYYPSTNQPVSDGFFDWILKIIEEQVTTNGNGTVDSNSFNSGYLTPTYHKVISVTSSVNSRIVLPYIYSNRYFFKVCAVGDLSKVAEESQTLTITYLDVSP